MDVNKFNALADLVKEAKQADRDTFVEMEAANAAWKVANKVLTERLKVLNDYAVQQINETTAI